MKRVVIKCKDGACINLKGDFIRFDEDFVFAWDGEKLIAVVRVELVDIAYVIEKGAGNETR